MPKRNAALMILAAVAACGTAEGDVGGGTMSTDSAGVHVVHIPGQVDAPEWQTEQRYREVWSVPIDQEHELAGIDAARLLDGHVAASILGRDPGIAFLDRATGTLLRRVGRLGEGPGEFRDIGRLYPGDDAVSAFDRRLRRVTTFTTSGELTGAADLGKHFGSATGVTFALPHGGGAVLVRSVFPEGEGTVRPANFVERYERGAAMASVGPFTSLSSWNSSLPSDPAIAPNEVDDRPAEWAASGSVTGIEPWQVDQLHVMAALRRDPDRLVKL